MQIRYAFVFPAAQGAPVLQTSLAGTPIPDPQSASRAEWSPWENALLQQAVLQFGVGDWGRIARLIGGTRTKAQCAQHWFRCLNPSIVKGRWSREEDEQLLALVDRYGARNWAKIARAMTSRSDVQCRHRYMHISQSRTEKGTERTPLPSIDHLLEGEARGNSPNTQH
jgi:hypothetical protein